MEKIIINNSKDHVRLDKFLAAKFPSLSRAFIKEQIKLGNFLINDKKAKAFYLLREGDQVALAPGFSLPETSAILPNPNIKLEIIYEDADVLAINKPAGLSVHPRQYKNGQPLASELDNTLVSALIAKYPLVVSVGDNPLLRPGIVHRLDKDTSGVMIIAKNQSAFEWLKKQFKERKVAKKYITLVHGQPKEKQGVLENFLARSATNPSKQKIIFSSLPLPSDEGRVGRGDERMQIITTPSLSPPQLRGRGIRGREAITEYRVIKEFDNYSLIEAYPKTGRLHQIRVQFAAMGHPVVGDKKYSSSKLPLPLKLNRQFLHAAELEIALPDGEMKKFESPLPEELQIIIK